MKKIFLFLFLCFAFLSNVAQTHYSVIKTDKGYFLDKTLKVNCDGIAVEITLNVVETDEGSLTFDYVSVKSNVKKLDVSLAFFGTQQINLERTLFPEYDGWKLYRFKDSERIYFENLALDYVVLKTSTQTCLGYTTDKRNYFIKATNGIQSFE